MNLYPLVLHTQSKSIYFTNFQGWKGGKAIWDRKHVVGNFFKSQLAPVQRLGLSNLPVLTSAFFF